MNNSVFNRGGGVAILVDVKYQSKCLKHFENAEIEGMCVEIKLNRNALIIYLAYVPELVTGRELAFQKHANCIEQIVHSTTVDVIVMGDST